MYRSWTQSGVFLIYPDGIHLRARGWFPQDSQIIGATFLLLKHDTREKIYNTCNIIFFHASGLSIE